MNLKKYKAEIVEAIDRQSISVKLTKTEKQSLDKHPRGSNTSIEQRAIKVVKIHFKREIPTCAFEDEPGAGIDLRVIDGAEDLSFEVKGTEITLCLSRGIVAEYFAVLGRFRMADEPEGKELMQLFEKRYNQVFVASPTAIGIVTDDPADDKFLECAVAADAGYIISGDRHLLSLKTFRGIRIMTPTEFLRLEL